MRSPSIPDGRIFTSLARARPALAAVLLARSVTTKRTCQPARSNTAGRTTPRRAVLAVGAYPPVEHSTRRTAVEVCTYTPWWRSSASTRGHVWVEGAGE
jgi:hypothetical protein